MFEERELSEIEPCTCQFEKRKRYDEVQPPFSLFLSLW